MYSSHVASISPWIHSEVLEKVSEAKWFSCGSCGSRAANEDVEVDSVVVPAAAADAPPLGLGSPMDAVGENTNNQDEDKEQEED